MRIRYSVGANSSPNYTVGAIGTKTTCTVSGSWSSPSVNPMGILMALSSPSTPHSPSIPLRGPHDHSLLRRFKPLANPPRMVRHMVKNCDINQEWVFLALLQAVISWGSTNLEILCKGFQAVAATWWRQGTPCSTRSVESNRCFGALCPHV